MALLVASQIAGQTGSWAALVAALPQALRSPEPAIWLALVNALWAGPAMLSAVAGRFIDRFGPRRTGTACWLAASACAATCVEVRLLPVLLVPLGLLSACRGIGVAAGDTAPTWMARRPDTGRSGSWLVIAAAVPLLAGPLGASTLLSRESSRWTWLAIASAFAVAAAAGALVPAIRPAPPPSISEPAPAAPLMRGAVGRVLTATAGIWLSYGSLEIIQPLYVRQVLHGSVGVYAWTLTAFALGGLTAGLTASVFPRKALASRLAVPIGALAVAASELAFTATASLSVALLGAALWGASAAAFTISSRSLMLSAAPPGSHGRAMTAWRSVQSMAYVAPATVIGSLVLALGLRASLHGICLLAGITGAGVTAQTIIRPTADRTLVSHLGRPGCTPAY